MKPLLLSYSDTIGGASRATLRLHHALKTYGVDIRMRVGIKTTDINTIDDAASKWNKIFSRARPHIGQLIMQLQKPNDQSSGSPNYLNSGLVEKLNASEFDLFNIHWVNNEFLSIEDIGQLRKPVILTLHDMWAFCGTEHYAEESATARWRNGYTTKNRPSKYSGIDLDLWAWTRKQKFWHKPMQIITPSHWLAGCVRNSKLMHDWPVSVIPNPIDIKKYQKWPKQLARSILSLPQETPLIMFGAIGGGKDQRKGWDLLESALQIMGMEKDIECVVFGQSEPEGQPKFSHLTHWMGHINDDVTLALLYSAADVMVVPSRQENLPQSATEAQACGCPVVAFNCTGIPDVVEHKKTGYLATAYNVEDLAQGILWVLSDVDRYKELSNNATIRATTLWSSDKIAAQYLETYASAVNNHQSGSAH